MRKSKSSGRSLELSGGGNHGHLGLILSPADYGLLSNVPFDCPAHPGTLVIPPGTAQHHATTMKDAHDKQIRVFREVNGVEQALLQQIIEAVNKNKAKTNQIWVQHAQRSKTRRDKPKHTAARSHRNCTNTTRTREPTKKIVLLQRRCEENGRRHSKIHRKGSLPTG